MKTKWTNEETQFLINNYPVYGIEYCENKLKKIKKVVRNKIRRLALKMECKNEKYNELNFRKTVSGSKSYTDVARNLGISTSCGNRNTIKKYIEKYNIDISHFDFGISGSRFVFGKFDLSDILIENSMYSQTTHLKNRLYKEGLKKRECEMCGQDENWKGKKMSLILDHINGIHNDNRIENLRIICPNCGATLETNGGKNIGNNYKEKFIELKQEKNLIKNKKHCICGKEINKKSEKCKSCEEVRQRKVKRPSYLELVEELKNSNYCAVGRKYGVSDNAIRKWIKNYENKLK